MSRRTDTLLTLTLLVVIIAGSTYAACRLMLAV